MELDGGFHIGKGFFTGIAFSYHDTFDANRIGDIAIGMLFYYYFYRLHLSEVWSFLDNKLMLSWTSFPTEALSGQLSHSGTLPSDFRRSSQPDVRLPVWARCPGPGLRYSDCS